MNAMCEQINATGKAFVEFTTPMLIQSAVLILILLGLDLILRKRVRAVVRYWMWMLVLFKLVLPTTLSLPTGLGYWLGDRLGEIKIQEPFAREKPQPKPPAPVVAATEKATIEPLTVIPLPQMDAAPRPTPPAPAKSEPIPTTPPMAPAMTWQGLVSLAWLAVAAAMALLLLQRALFVRALVAQSKEPDGFMNNAFEFCRQQINAGRKVTLKVSPNATSPAVCGLFRPVILVPHNLGARLGARDLRAVFLHELAHIKRGDLWVNLVQTLLQIVYFYNPLLWLANAMIRRVREQAVDEMVLVAMGEKARWYPQTLVNVAKLAFERPALSLRLIGVVESKDALAARIKRILNRPTPKHAKLGALGLLAIIIAAAVMLPMAKGQSNKIGWFDRKTLVKFESDDKPEGTHRTVGDVKTYSKTYDVTFRKGERLLVLAELYQPGKPMRRLGHKIFDGGAEPQKLSLSLIERSGKQTVEDGSRHVNYQMLVELGEQEVAISTDVTAPALVLDTAWRWWPGAEIAKEKQYGKPISRLHTLLAYERLKGGQGERLRFWMPGHDVTQIGKDKYTILLKMVPLSQLDYLVDFGPMLGDQLPDGSIFESSRPEEVRRHQDQYFQSVKGMVLPLPKLTAHKYYKAGEPIRIEMKSNFAVNWKPSLEEMSDDKDTFFVLVNGKEYKASPYVGPFNGLTCWHRVPKIASEAPGKYRFAYGWRNVDVVNPEKPDKVIHFDRLITDEAEFEVVDDVPEDYYQQTYKDGWEDILRENTLPLFTDDMRKYGVSGPLLALKIKELPFDVAFDIYAQAEGSEEEEPAGQIAIRAGSYNHITGCDRNVKGLTWDNVGDRRWRLILKPSQKAAASHPPIHHYYGREFVTDWLTFERSERFDYHRRRAKNTRNSGSGKQNSDFTANLPNGVTVELLGVCDWPRAGQRCWRPDGSQLTDEIYATKWNKTNPDPNEYGFMVKVNGPVDLNFRWMKIEGATSREGSCHVVDSQGNPLKNCEAAISDMQEGKSVTNVRVGIAVGPWKTIAEHDGKRMATKPSPDGNVLFSQAFETDEGVGIVLSDIWRKDSAERIVAVDSTGKTIAGSSIGSVATGQIDQYTALFYGLKLEDVHKFVYQFRPYECVEFKNVSLKPNFKTDVQVEAEEPTAVAEGTRRESVQVKPAAEGFVDLAVADSDMTVSNKLQCGCYRVSVTIRNNGTLTSPPCRVHYYVGDPDEGGKEFGGRSGYHVVRPIAPGQASKDSRHFNLEAGSCRVFVVVDPNNEVSESDKTNNKCSTPLVPTKANAGGPDIAVEDFKIVFNQKYNACYVVASIHNKGKDVSPQFPVYFYIGDPATAEAITHAAGPIKPGGVWNERSGNFGLREGANIISVAVDPDNAFAESDETNNRASLSVFIEAGRIVKQSVSYSSGEATESGPCPEHTEVESGRAPTAHRRHFVRQVVGPVTYRVTIPDDNWRIAKVNCQMATGGALSLWMNNNGAPRVPEGHGAFVRNLRAVDSAGNALVINDFGRGRWMIDGKDNQPVTLSYEVLLRHDESDLPWGPDEAPYVTEDGVFWTGRALFVVADMSDVTVRFNLPEGWRVSTPWGHRLNQESTFSLEDEEELTESFIFAGTHIEEQARVGDTEIVLVLGNALRGSRELIQNCLQELLRQYSELFGAAAPGRALVVVNAQDKKGSFDGGVFGSSVSMLMGDEPGRNNTGRWAPFVAHEVFHIWNGQALKHGGQEDWFSEGFTDYYAMVACARLNLISEEEFVRRLGRACEGYISISGNKPIRGAREHGLQYAGGSLVAACLDIQIRKLTDNTRNLDDLMRQMYEEFGRTGRQYCVEDVIRIANDIAGKDLGEFFKEYVEGTEELALEKAFADIGLELKKDVTEGLPARAYVIHKMLHIESLRHSGLLIRRSPEAGYRDEDRLRAIAGTPVESVRDIQTVAKRLNRGDKTEVVLLRDGKEVRMEITVGGEGKQVPLERKVEVEIEKEAELNASQKSILSGMIGS